MWLYTRDVCEEKSAENCNVPWMIRTNKKGCTNARWYAGAEVTCASDF